jgi:inhibitor of cysteine peptidase
MNRLSSLLAQRISILSLASIVVFGGVACGGSVTDDASSDDSEDELRRSVALTDLDNGKTVTVTEGQSINLTLESNATTGYAWSVTSTDKTLGYPTERFLSPSSSALGASGQQRFTWKTKSPLSMIGKHTVTLAYARSFEKNVKPARTFKFTVDVVAAASPSANLTDKDDGATVTVKSGVPVVVSLESNPTTGYGWMIVSTDKTFGYPEEAFVAASPAIGSGGTEKFTWKTSSPLSMVGSHTVHLEYKRAWEKNVAPLKKFAFTVDITN